MPETATLAPIINDNGHDKPVNGLDTEADIQAKEHHSQLRQPGDILSQQIRNVREINGYHSDAPPRKRRKLLDGDTRAKSSSRPTSPPWKSFEAAGPTTFVEDGRRKSGRTNAISSAAQPPSNKRKTRANQKATPTKHTHNLSSVSTRGKQDVVKQEIPVKRGPGRPPKNTSAVAVAIRKEAIIANPVPKSIKSQDISTPSRKSSRIVPTKSKREVPIKAEDESVPRTHDSSELSSKSPSPPLLLKKVSFRVRVPQPTVNAPANLPLTRQWPSFENYIENDTLDEPSARQPWTPEQIRREAAARLRVQLGMRPGQLSHLSTLHRQPEPKKEYTHQDHMLGHIKHFRSLMVEEKRRHVKEARDLAYEAKQYCEEKQTRSGNVKALPKTYEEIEREKTAFCRACYKNVAKDLLRLWQAVEMEANTSRRLRYEEEQKAKLQGHLNRVLDRTSAMLKQDTDLSEDVSAEGTDLSDDTDQTDNDDNDSDNSEQISASDSESQDSAEGADDDANLTAEQLKAKYGNIPELQRSSDSPGETQDGDWQSARDEEDSDPETVMDSELDSDESEDNEDDGSVDEGSDDEDEGQDAGLLSLFSKKERIDMRESNQVTSTDLSVEGSARVDTRTDTGGSDTDQAVEAQVVTNDQEGRSSSSDAQHDLNHIALGGESSRSERYVADTVVEDQEVTISDPMDIYKGREVNMTLKPASRADPSQPPTPAEPTGTRVPIPSLLRATLRDYQHEGLDWLANLYANGRSGILADEMGLGKTIQSIALLAHLATTYEVWGPHLIVVPTSVMLNWEMEFKKFLPGFKVLTYYGSLEERKAKRRGWTANDNFNVCITSYQLVLQDANSFKRRPWHYMILDEAHNIKNFRSARWQTMMTFNTRARLLLTGTPLQNNLTELWSLLFFLHYGQEQEGDDDAFAGLREWSEWFKRPVESILEHGRQVLDQEDQAQVAKLHKVIRPFLLRRLKRDVEKQMPLKYEHVELCRLSKRQRQLYDGFMSRAQTRETLASGNYLSIINALMQLRKVCNHPDLFETRPINTSFAMARSVAAQYEINDFLIRRRLHQSRDEVDLKFLQLAPISHEQMSMVQLRESQKWHAYLPLQTLRDRQYTRVQHRSKLFASATRAEVLSSLESVGRRARYHHIGSTMYYEAFKHHQHPIYGSGLLGKLDLNLRNNQLEQIALGTAPTRCWERTSPLASLHAVRSLSTRSQALASTIDKFACVTPAVVVLDLPVMNVTSGGAHLIRTTTTLHADDPFHLSRMKLSIAFPDKRLLQYDCGKLQRLAVLLRTLQAGGHRALIFTQMTKVLDILESFLNIHGHRYLRLDGATKIEQRQILTDRFNNDPKILCFILSSRSGGLGINLTGADTVIFYDLDWNPAMDKQCTDRAHRIGQTRDVHIYRFVSEHTIESNILRKANQKQLLDDVVIQEGDFTTDYLSKLNYKDVLNGGSEDEDVAGAAMDRVLGNNRGGPDRSVLEQVEDKEDIDAARVAAKEEQNADEGDFDDAAAHSMGKHNTTVPARTQVLDPYTATNAAIQEVEASRQSHMDDYLLRTMEWLLKDTPMVLPKERDRRKKGRERDRRRR